MPLKYVYNYKKYRCNFSGAGGKLDEVFLKFHFRGRFIGVLCAEKLKPQFTATFQLFLKETTSLGNNKSCNFYGCLPVSGGNLGRRENNLDDVLLKC